MSLPRKTLQQVLDEMPDEVRNQVKGWHARAEAIASIPEEKIISTAPGTFDENDRILFTTYTDVETAEYKAWHVQNTKIKRLITELQEVIRLQEGKEYQARSRWIMNWFFSPAPPKVMTLNDLPSKLRTDVELFFMGNPLVHSGSTLDDINYNLVRSIGKEPLGPGQIMRLYNIKTKQLSTPFSIRSLDYTFEPKIKAEKKPEEESNCIRDPVSFSSKRLG